MPPPWEGWDTLPDQSEVIESPSQSGDTTFMCSGTPDNPAGLTANAPIIGNTGNAIRVEAAFGEIDIIGNEFSDLTGRCLALDKDGMNIEFTGNLCKSADRGIFQNWRDNFSLDVADNTFEDIAGPALEYESGTVIDGPVIYNNTTANSAAEINALPQASDNTVSP